MREFARTQFNKGFDFWLRYEHRLGVGALAVGFIFDLIIAKSPDNIPDNILLLSYLFIAGAIIAFFNLRESNFWLLLLLQFCFGGLASNLLVLYGKSGTLTVSAIFLGLLVTLVLGNEYLRSRYDQLRFNIGVYYFLLLTYACIAAPTFLFHRIGGWPFFLSTVLSVLAMVPFFLMLRYAIKSGKREQKLLWEARILVGSIFLLFNLLYFFNIIPPVPLSLKDIGIYHSVLKQSSGNYLALYEPSPWYQFWRDTSKTYHASVGGNAYCFSSVYAPADLGTPIYHEWQYFSKDTNDWETMTRVSFPISGGREEGYRGFSVESMLTPGKWRCNVETAGGALIGRTSFEVTRDPLPELFSTRTL